MRDSPLSTLTTQLRGNGWRGTQAELQPAEVTPPHHSQWGIHTKATWPRSTTSPSTPTVVPSLQTPVQPALQPHKHFCFFLGGIKHSSTLAHGRGRLKAGRKPAHPPRSGSGGPTPSLDLVSGTDKLGWEETAPFPRCPAITMLPGGQRRDQRRKGGLAS